MRCTEAEQQRGRQHGLEQQPVVVVRVPAPGEVFHRRQPVEDRRPSAAAAPGRGSTAGRRRWRGAYCNSDGGGLRPRRALAAALPLVLVQGAKGCGEASIGREGQAVPLGLGTQISRASRLTPHRSSPRKLSRAALMSFASTRSTWLMPTKPNSSAMRTRATRRPRLSRWPNGLTGSALWLRVEMVPGTRPDSSSSSSSSSSATSRPEGRARSAASDGKQEQSCCPRLGAAARWVCRQRMHRRTKQGKAYVACLRTPPPAAGAAWICHAGSPAGPGPGLPDWTRAPQAA